MSAKRIVKEIQASINKVIVRISGAHYGCGVRFNKFCRMTKRTNIGDDCHFNGTRIVGGGDVFIGDHFHSGEDCLFITQNHNYDGGDQLPYDDTLIMKSIMIGKNVWIGSRVIILPGSNIGDGAIIQAGSVVCGAIERCGIAGGHPARVFKYRDIAHYEALLEKQKKCMRAMVK